MWLLASWVLVCCEIDFFVHGFALATEEMHSLDVHHKNLIQRIRFAGKLSDEKIVLIILVSNHQNPDRF